MIIMSIESISKKLASNTKRKPKRSVDHYIESCKPRIKPHIPQIHSNKEQ